MALDLSRYTARMNAYGYETKDGRIEHQKAIILDGFNSHPNYQPVMIDGTERDVHIISKSSLEKNPEINVMVAKPDETFDNGQYVVWGNTTWITLNDFANDDISKAIEIQRCRINLNFTYNSTEYSYPATRKILSESSHGASVKQNIDLPTGEFRLYIKRDQNTESIYEGQRFIINGDGYSVDHVEKLDFDNVLTLFICYDGENKDADDLSNDKADNSNPSGWTY